MDPHFNSPMGTQSQHFYFDHNSFEIRPNVATNFFPINLHQNSGIFQYSVSILRIDKFKKRRQQFHSCQILPTCMHRNDENLNNNTMFENEYDDIDLYMETSSTNISSFNQNVFEGFAEVYGSQIQAIMAYDEHDYAYSPKLIDFRFIGKYHKLQVDPQGYLLRYSKNQFLCFETVYVGIHYVKMLDYEHPPHRGSYITALNIIFAQVAKKNGLARYQNSFYQPCHMFYHDEDLCEKWPGFSQSICQTIYGPCLLIDTCCTHIWKFGGQPLLEMCKYLLGGQVYWNLKMHKEYILSRLKNLNVQTLHTGNIHGIYAFSERSAAELTFAQEGKRLISVAQYFEEQYHVTLQQPNTPCVRIHPWKDIFVPMEMLIIVPNQRIGCNGTCSKLQRPDDLDPPEQRFWSIINIVRGQNYCQNNLILAFNISIYPVPIEVNARLLGTGGVLRDDMQISYMNNQTGCWNLNVERLFSHLPQKARWSVLNLSNLSNAVVSKFTHALQKLGQIHGMTVGKPSKENCSEPRTGNDGERLRALLRASSASSLVLIFVNDNDTYRYNLVKSIGELDFGVPTQVIKTHAVRDVLKREFVLQTIIAKVATKLSAIMYVPNAHVLNRSFFNCTLLIGISTMRCGDESKFSTHFSLVGSIDRNLSSYAGVFHERDGLNEIAPFEKMFPILFKEWKHRKSHTQPLCSIIMFRDTPHDSDYREVMRAELHQLRNACRNVQHENDGQKITVTYISVTKRHIVRLFPKDRPTTGNSGNLVPGVVVGERIVGDTFLEFYLNSHEGISGTSKAARYTVLVDENNIQPTELQNFVYRLTHGSMRCNQSISIVVCLQYARILVARKPIYDTEELNTHASAHISTDARPKKIPTYCMGVSCMYLV